MRSIKKTIAGLAIILGMVAVVNAADAEDAKAPDASKEMKNQTHCPVMGGAIDSTVFTDIQGQRVYHCCPMCSDKLKADPDKYFKQAAKDGIVFENIQTTCPVSGEKLTDKSVTVNFEGRRVAFCCEKCVGAFKEDPATYLKKLDKGADATSDKKKAMDHDDHSGHNH